MKLGIIAAVSENGVIGNRGRLPWKHIHEDMKHFKDLTYGHPIIMGRKTFESLPNGPLEARLNIVLSRREFFSEGVLTYSSLEESLDYLNGLPSNFYPDPSKVYIIGGGEVYREAMPLVNFMEITKIRGEYGGDTFFPKVNEGEWRLIEEKHFEKFSFISYKDRKT